MWTSELWYKCMYSIGGVLMSEARITMEMVLTPGETEWEYGRYKDVLVVAVELCCIGQVM